MADTAFTLNEDVVELPQNFRKLNARQKREALSDLLDLSRDELVGSFGGDGLIDLADVMVESAVGLMPVPMGVASGISRRPPTPDAWYRAGETGSTRRPPGRS